ncbi:hypothetical protein N9C31_01285 [Gammaproteobacteria bacterium]|nr:hypothetical protein [Gammaproteobacteria bacterium]
MHYLLLAAMAFLGGCSTLVHQAEIDQLSPVQKKSFYASVQPELLPTTQVGSGQTLVVDVKSGKIMVNADFEPLSGGQLVVVEGRCNSMMLHSQNHARVLKICFDHEAIRIGTGLHIRQLANQKVLQYGINIENFLTDEDDGIYSLNLQLRVS